MATALIVQACQITATMVLVVLHVAHSAFVFPALAQPVAQTDDFASWPPLRSTFPSTGGGGITIKGYDPVITGGKCVTTFMAVENADAAPDTVAPPKVYANYVEFDAVPAAGGILCQNGRWRAMEGGASGTTSFRVFFKEGVFRASP